jgi:hypothetical protein
MATPKNDTPQNAEKATLAVTSDGMKVASGSQSVHFQRELLDQVTASLWLPEWKTSEQKLQAAKAAYKALQGIAPRSEVEDMLAAQMLSTHNAAMESLRRAMMESQTFEGRDQNLEHATKLMGLYDRQLAALDKHRGKGWQKITVEHVNVHAGGQAIVGNVDGSAPSPSKAAPAQRALSDAPDNGVPLPDPLASPARAKQRARKSSK